MNQVTTDKLMQDLRVVIGDADDLLKATANQTGERVQQLRARTEESLRGVRARLEVAAQDADRTAREAVQRVDAQVREYPWTAVGMAAGVGVLLGILLGRQ
jgi:ElaB/YqjD/DUF883 family membrane-anchored ribosome-binding protein